MPSRLASSQQQKKQLFSKLPKIPRVFTVFSVVKSLTLGSVLLPVHFPCVYMLLQCLVCLSILSGVRLKGMAFSTMIFCIQQPGFATYPHVSTIIKQLWGLLKSGYLLTNLWDRTLNFITLWLIAGFSPTLSNESLLSVFDLHMRSHSRIHSQMLLVSYTNYEQTILWGLQLCQHSYCCTRPKNTQHSYHALFFLYKNKSYKNIEAQNHQRGWKFKNKQWQSWGSGKFQVFL